jgi:putative FmdB family regulatory protein
MPVYEYRCSKCDTKMSVKRGINETDPGYACETCNLQMIRVYSLGAVTFNGSGFYSKDK